MTSATTATLIGGGAGIAVRAWLAQNAVPIDVAGWLTTVGVGGSLSLIFWIVAKELPAFRQAAKESQADYKSSLKEVTANFQNELAKEREASRLERVEYMKERTVEREACAVERTADREARHASANALNAVATTVRELGEKLPEK